MVRIHLDRILCKTVLRMDKKKVPIVWYRIVITVPYGTVVPYYIWGTVVLNKAPIQ